MKVFLAIALTLFGFGLTQAQNTELSIGALFTRSDPNLKSPNFHFDKTTDQLGADISGTLFFGDRPVGLTADVGATWKGGADDASLATIMAGPTLKARGKRWQPFGRALIGVGRFAARNQQLSFSFDRTTAGLAWAAGGGLDINVSKRVAFRALQLDYLGTRIDHKNVRYLRAGMGLVFRW